MADSRDIEAEEVARDRQERIAALEKRLARGRPVGVRAPVALLCIAGALFLGWLDRADIAYFFSSREPITLGTEGDYALNELVPNRYVQLHGVPTSRGVYADEHGQTFVIVGLKDSPFLVKRHALEGETLTPGRPAPQPNQSPFGMRGRLYARAGAERYEKAFADLQAWEELRPLNGQLYLVAEGEKPGTDFGLAVVMGLLALFIAVNGYFAVADLRYRLKARSVSETRAAAG